MTVLLLAFASCACAAVRGDDHIASFVRLVGPRSVYSGLVTETRGLAVDEGALCEVAITGTDHETYTCRIRIRCGGDVVYGVGDAGFNHCERDERGTFVWAHDDGVTRADGDPRLELDVDQGRVVVAGDHPPTLLRIVLRRNPSPDPRDG